MNGAVAITVPRDVFKQLAPLFPVHSSGGDRWIILTSNGVRVMMREDAR